jgi:hypothetical protein
MLKGRGLFYGGLTEKIGQNQTQIKIKLKLAYTTKLHKLVTLIWVDILISTLLNSWY